MLRAGLITLIVICLSLFFCLRDVHTQSNSIKRITNSAETQLNLNPSLSGDGAHIVFESTANLSGGPAATAFHTYRADVAGESVSFGEVAPTRAVAPAVSQDGSRIAFSSSADLAGRNADRNSEIYFYDGARLTQITDTLPADISRRLVNGNFQPSISDDGRLIAFSSNRDVTGLNGDLNQEIFLYDAETQSFRQITDTLAPTVCKDAKVSGDASRIAYLRFDAQDDTEQSDDETSGDLILFDRTSGATKALASKLPGLSLTYGRAISDDGSRVVYSAQVGPDDSEVFIFDGRKGLTRQITSLGARAGDVALNPSVSGDGARLSFATRRNVPGGVNSDHSVELYVLDLPTGQITQVTSAPSSATAEVVSSLNDDGTLLAFNFPRALSGAVTSKELSNNTEIYLAALAPRPAFAAGLKVLNGASMGNEPAQVKTVAPASIAAAFGRALAFTSEQAQTTARGAFPFELGGTTVAVNGRPAEVLFVSPTQVNFLVPPQTETGTAEVFVANSEGFQTRGAVEVARSAPGVFTFSGDGLGEGVILDAETLTRGPFDPSGGRLRLIIFATGIQNSSKVEVFTGGRAATVESVNGSPDLGGLDEIHVLLPPDLRGLGTQSLTVRADGRDSNAVEITLSGEPRRDIVINEILADPPDGIEGDANRDGTRSASQDEFVEMVNAGESDLDISGYQILTRSSTAVESTLRHTFAPGTIFPAGTCIVVFGGASSATFNPGHPAFGGAQVFTAKSGGLSLTNGGGFVTVLE
ncbi:MAG TPA: lamin tail domain-containing protein, partial [Pyrinomonadaceae bacterium]